MTDPSPPQPPSLVKCPRHSLLFDPAKMTGCVLCRRDGLDAPEIEAGQAAEADRGLALPLVLAAVLCLLAALAFYSLQGAISTGVEGIGFKRTVPPAGPANGASSAKPATTDQAVREFEDMIRSSTADPERTPAPPSPPPPRPPEDQ